MEKYVKLKHVKELMNLIYKRDSYYDWLDEYEKYDKKVNNTIQWLERNAKTKIELEESLVYIVKVSDEKYQHEFNTLEEVNTYLINRGFRYITTEDKVHYWRFGDDILAVCNKED